jgi:hypothetical protein
MVLPPGAPEMLALLDMVDTATMKPNFICPEWLSVRHKITRLNAPNLRVNGFQDAQDYVPRRFGIDPFMGLMLVGLNGLYGTKVNPKLAFSSFAYIDWVNIVDAHLLA